MDVEKNWFYAVGNERKGPLTRDELTVLANQGTIRADSLVWQDGMASWVPADQVHGLLPSIPIPPPLPTSSGVATVKPAVVPAIVKPQKEEEALAIAPAEEPPVGPPIPNAINRSRLNPTRASAMPPTSRARSLGSPRGDRPSPMMIGGIAGGVALLLIVGWAMTSDGSKKKKPPETERRATASSVEAAPQLPIPEPATTSDTVERPDVRAWDTNETVPTATVDPPAVAVHEFDTGEMAKEPVDEAPNVEPDEVEAPAKPLQQQTVTQTAKERPNEAVDAESLRGFFDLAVAAKYSEAKKLAGDRRRNDLVKIARVLEARRESMAAGATTLVGKGETKIETSNETLKGAISKADDKGLVIMIKHRMGGGFIEAKKTVKWGSLTPAQQDRLAVLGAWPPETNEGLLAKSLLMLTRDDLPAAARYAEQADHPLCGLIVKATEDDDEKAGAAEEEIANVAADRRLAAIRNQSGEALKWPRMVRIAVVGPVIEAAWVDGKRISFAPVKGYGGKTWEATVRLNVGSYLAMQVAGAGTGLVGFQDVATQQILATPDPSAWNCAKAPSAGFVVGREPGLGRAESAKVGGFPEWRSFHSLGFGLYNHNSLLSAKGMGSKESNLVLRCRFTGVLVRSPDIDRFGKPPAALAPGNNTENLARFARVDDTSTQVRLGKPKLLLDGKIERSCKIVEGICTFVFLKHVEARGVTLYGVSPSRYPGFDSSLDHGSWFVVESSTDGRQWSPVSVTTPWLGGMKDVVLDKPVRTRLLRVRCTTGKGELELYEVEVWGRAAR